MSETKTNNITVGGSLYSIFWIANLVYACIFWGGWHIFFNIFLPYSILFDVIYKYSHYLRP